MRSILNKILKKTPSSNQDGFFFEKITKILGFKPNTEIYYKHAFTHRSSNQTDENGFPISYERLEFLGDAMLSREHLNELGKDFNLVQFIESKVSPSHFGDNIHGNLCEAFIGAIYLDKGYTYCEKFIQEKIIKQYIDIERLEGKVISYKSVIIEWCQKEKITFKFDIFEDDGKEGVKYFGVKFLMDDQVISKARATSKKKAEETAAKRAFFALQDKIENKS